MENKNIKEMKKQAISALTDMEDHALIIARKLVELKSAIENQRDDDFSIKTYVSTIRLLTAELKDNGNNILQAVEEDFA